MLTEPFKKGQKLRIVFKTLVGSINYSGKLAIVKYVSLVYIGLTYNISPVATVVMSYVILGEKLSLTNLILFGVTLAGVILIVIGYKDDYYKKH
jgi:drug/metabolite transporter (DMT)-like permease